MCCNECAHLYILFNIGRTVAVGKAVGVALYCREFLTSGKRRQRALPPLPAPWARLGGVGVRGSTAATGNNSCSIRENLPCESCRGTLTVFINGSPWPGARPEEAAVTLLFAP